MRRCAGLAQLGLLDNADIPEPEEGHSRPAQLRGRAGQAAAHRRGARALRRPPPRVSGRRDPAAPDALLPARRQQRARDRLRRRDQRGRQEDARHRRLRRHDAHRQERRRARVRERAARARRASSSCWSTRRDAASSASATRRRQLERQRAGRRQRPVPDDRSCACSRRRKKRCAASARRRSRSTRRTATCIAFVSTPAFDPNLFARGLSRAEYLALTEDPDRPMYDRALRGVYPPGSTVKPMFALAALEVRRGRRRTTLASAAAAGPRPATDACGATGSPEGHGTVDMRRAHRDLVRRVLLRHRATDGHRSHGELSSRSSAWAPPPASTSQASAAASCRRRHGRSAPTAKQGICRSGFPATRSASASARGRCS